MATFLALSLAGATAPLSSLPRQEPPAAPVVRVTTALVQVDAVVTDEADRHVTDLTAADFEVFEDGLRRDIVHCSYVRLPKLPEPAPVAPSPLAAVVPPPPSRLRPERVRRTIALVVDDLGLSFRSTIEVREALRRFVGEQMEPGDLAAIIRTRGGMGALQQFTDDKAQLRAAIDRVRFDAALNRMGIDWFAPVGESKNLIDTNAGPRGSGPPVGKDVDGLRESMLIEATLNSVKFVVGGLRELPGRKAVVVFSDGLRLFQDVDDRQRYAAAATRGRRASASRQEAPQGSQPSDARITGALGQLVDLANRSSVVLYTVDTRGLTTHALDAADDVSAGLGVADIGSVDLRGSLDARRRQGLENQEGLQYVARETGGFLVRSQNDLAKAVERVLEDQRGYYLVGYAPDPDTFKSGPDRPAFHRIELSVKRPGLQVRSRAGFYGRIDEGDEAAAPAQDRPLSVVLASPFAQGDIRLHLTSLFVHDPKQGYVLRSLFHLDARDLALQEREGGALGTTIELLAVTLGDDGAVIDQLGRVQEVRVTPHLRDQAMKEGLTYRLDVPVKKPGAYQLRVAIRDKATGRVGTASQLVRVPDLGERQLALSGIAVGTLRGDAASAEALGAQAAAALRQFRPGQALSYGYVVYNARLDKKTGLPRLDSQMRLFRDGEPLTIGEKRPIETAATGSREVVSGGAFVLGPEMPPGDYVLQVIVTDFLAGRNAAVVAQAVDFEVRP